MRALAIAGEHKTYRSKPRKLISWVPLGILRYLLQLSASWVLLRQPEEMGVNGAIYESTHASLERDLLFQKPQ